MGTVISQFTRHLQGLLAEEDCNRILALYSAMCMKTNTVRDNVYHSNCVEQIGDDRCYRFEFEYVSTSRVHV